MKKLMIMILSVLVALSMFAGCKKDSDNLHGATVPGTATEAAQSASAQAPQVYAKIHKNVTTSFSVTGSDDVTSINYATKPVKWDNNNYDSTMDESKLPANVLKEGAKISMDFTQQVPTKIEITRNGKTAVEVSDNSFTINYKKSSDVYTVTCTFKDDNTLKYIFNATKPE